MTVDAFLKLLVESAHNEFANSEWYVQSSAVELSISIHVAGGQLASGVEGYKWMNSFIEHASIEDALFAISDGIKSVARRTAIPHG